MSGYKRVNFYDLCRLCASHQRRERTHIFEDKGRKIHLQDKIQTCLSLQVCENDFLPKVVCAECLEILEQSCSFQQECYRSETMLVSYFNNFRHTEEFKKSGKVYIKDSVQKQIRTDVEIDLTPPSTPSAAITVATASTNTDYSLNIVPNVLPQELMSSFYTLQLPPAPMATATPVIQQGPQFVTTPMLQQLQDNYRIMTQPQIIYGNKFMPNIPKSNISDGVSITVNSNGEVIGTTPIIDVNTYLNQHKLMPQRKVPDNPNILKNDLLPNEPEKINVISNQSVVYNQIQPNFNRVTNITNMNVISVPYESAIVNPPHEESPSSTPSPPPPTPNYQSPDVFTPPQVPDITTPPSPSYTPTKPNCKPSDSSNPKNQKPKSYACSICLRAFKRREHLCQHVKLHTGFRPHKCENCNKSYIRKEHLMRHLTSHNGEKKFICETCDRSFSRHDNLLKHKKTHDRQIYTCDICQRKFLLEQFYLAHKNLHENEKSAIVENWNVMKAA